MGVIPDVAWLHDRALERRWVSHAVLALGALCGRPWHDRLEVVAEGAAAGVLGPDEPALCSAKLWFALAEAAPDRAHDPQREVFSGCPLTSRLAEALRAVPPALERRWWDDARGPRAPEAAVAERIWRSQFPATTRWGVEGPFRPAVHFTLVALVRCEIQAIEQHWSLHRIAASLTDGQMDETLARETVSAGAGKAPGPVAWPEPRPRAWSQWLRAAVAKATAAELADVRGRQQAALQRECDRIDRYFEDYARELAARAERGRTEESRGRLGDRLAAARAEHARHRHDQAARHEVVVHPHVDALMIGGEAAWGARIALGRTTDRADAKEAIFVPRARRWAVPAAEVAADGTEVAARG